MNNFHLKNKSQLSQVNSCSCLFFSSDNIFTLTVDGKTLITYTETDPFVIKYIGFFALRISDEARFYFNCKSKHGNGVSKFNQFYFSNLFHVRVRNCDGIALYLSSMIFTQLKYTAQKHF